MYRYNLNLFVLLMIASSLPLFGGEPEPKTVVKGVPVVRISEGGIVRVPETLKREDAVNYACVISEIGGQYYWATRENKRLVRLVSGAFVTFLAIDGSGYVRIIPSTSKELASIAGPTESTFDYVEHLLIGLASVTYYGTFDGPQ